jgi:phosphoglycolate phosphatase-like HAD superfamily hydrolase
VEFLEHFKIPGFSTLLKALSQVCQVNQTAVYVGDRGVDCVASSRVDVDSIMVNRRGESSPSDLNCRSHAVVENLLELPSALSKL